MLWSLAAKNVRHRALSYAAYFLSSAFAVWLFYLYSTLLAHPQLQAEIVGWELRVPLQGVQWVVGVFSVLFVEFAHSTFLKLKQKELGVMSLVGMLPSQIAATVFAENIIIGGTSMATGMLFSVVLAKLLFLAAGRAFGLAVPLSYHFSLSATLLTIAVFGAVFTAVSAQAYFRITRTPLAGLIRDAAAPKRPPKASPVLFAACLVAIGGAYWLALTADGPSFERRFLPLAVLLLLGTYLLFSQVTTGALALMRRIAPVYYHRSNMLSIAQLGYKVRDNVRALFMVSVLTLFVLFAISTYYSAQASLERYTLERMPQSLLIVAKQGTLSSSEISAVLANHGLTVTRELHAPVLLGPVESAEGMRYTRVPIMRLSDVNSQLTATGRQPLTLRHGEFMALKPSGTDPFDGVSAIRPAFGGSPGETLTYAGVNYITVFDETAHIYAPVVVDDETFGGLYASFGDRYGVSVHAYVLPDWHRSMPAVIELENQLGISTRPEAKPPVSPSVPTIRPEGELEFRPSVVSAVEAYERGRQDASMMLFLMTLMGLLFFLVAGNMLYFKMFNELYADRAQYQALFKLGLAPEDLRRIISVQTSVLFFAPLVVAAVHAAVAMTVIAKLIVGFGLLKPTLAVVLAYAVLQSGYYLVTRQTYVRAVLRDL